MKPTLIQLCGLPGAGKSTWAERCGLVARVVTADEIRAGMPPFRAFLIMWNRVDKELREGRSVIIDTCALRAMERSRALQHGRRYAARCELVLFDTAEALCRERNARRNVPALVDWPRYVARMRVTREIVASEGWDSVRKASLST